MIQSRVAQRVQVEGLKTREKPTELGEKPRPSRRKEEASLLKVRAYSWKIARDYNKKVCPRELKREALKHVVEAFMATGKGFVFLEFKYPEITHFIMKKVKSEALWSRLLSFALLDFQ
ncbi:hypothetical protein U1Q18_002328 [Sarracenia purpurea var. burkii]